MPLVHMQKPKTLRKEMMADVPMPDSGYDGPKYPYGLRLDLCNDELVKLGLDADDFMLDEPVTISAKGKVMRTSKSESENYEGEAEYNQNVEIQITHLELIPGGVSVVLGDVLKRQVFKAIK